MLILGFIIAVACECEYHHHPENSTSPNNSNISNTYCLDADAETCDAVAKMLKAKRELSDGPTIIAYIAIAAILVIPQMPQLDI